MTGTWKGKGPIAWMAGNPVAANLLMLFLLAGGVLIGSGIKQEVFPEVELDRVSIMVPYPGASPEEVEKGIILPIEEAVRGLDGVKRVTSQAAEGVGTVIVELLLGANRDKLLQDVKNAVDRIVSFPQDAERPVVSLLESRHEVISILVFGDVGRKALRETAEYVRDELLLNKGITQVELAGVRPLEISIEVPQRKLRTYGLTLEEIARKVGRWALEIPGGEVKTPGGNVLLRLEERRDWGRQFADIPLVSRPDGTDVTVGDVAEIIDGFADTDQATFFNGKPAVQVKVYRVGDQTPLEVAAEVKETVKRIRSKIPPGIELSTFMDWSRILRERMDLLLRNARLGLILVMLLLGLFMEIRLAFWVTLGIPVSFLGSLIFLPAMGVSINMISLFAFIVTLGIVVDDAIVVGENVYELRQKGMPFLEAAALGARQMAVPVSFSILTNIAAFIPLFFVPGMMGKFFVVIPSVVVAVFAISWMESIFILPAHLGHQKEWRRRGPGRLIGWLQDKFAAALDWQIRKLYCPFVRACLRNRYLTVAGGFALLVAVVGYVAGGRIDFIFMPHVESDMVLASAALPFGTPVELTMKVEKRMVDAAKEVLRENGGEKICEGILAQVGNTMDLTHFMAKTQSGGHLTSVLVYLVPADRREISSKEFERQWREKIGKIPGLESLKFLSTAGPGAQADIDVELSHKDRAKLEAAARELAGILEGFQGVTEVDKGFSPGKPQLNLKVRPEASSLGLTSTDLGRQVRSAFFGAEALRQERGRNEVRVYVRYPKSERRSEFDVEDFLLRSPRGGEIPLMEAARVRRGRSYTVIQRADGRRVLDVTAKVVPGVTTADKVLADLKEKALPELMKKYDGLGYSLEGQNREQKESLDALSKGFLLALFGIFALLAVPFKSYLQPVIIMAAIPFGVVGAVLGHILMGYDLSIISAMGIVALAGVVVNDSLVLVHAANTFRDEKGLSPFEAVARAGARRFRPIILTSLTTFFGLAPMIFETSVQAKFLIPMAISLGFGILFSTFIALLLVPALYLVVEDLKWLFLGARD